jgi:transcriptional regulator with XRE-family HTH domain
MIDKRIGKRIKECRERLGLTQDDFAEKTGLTTNYISTVERGASFPRCEKLLTIINGLETSADAIFCDVIDHSTDYQASRLSQELSELPIAEQKRILQMVELMIRQAKENQD